MTSAVRPAATWQSRGSSVQRSARTCAPQGTFGLLDLLVLGFCRWCVGFDTFSKTDSTGTWSTVGTTRRRLAPLVLRRACALDALLCAGGTAFPYQNSIWPRIRGVRLSARTLARLQLAAWRSRPFCSSDHSPLRISASSRICRGVSVPYTFLTRFLAPARALSGFWPSSLHVLFPKTRFSGKMSTAFSGVAVRVFRPRRLVFAWIDRSFLTSIGPVPSAHRHLGFGVWSECDPPILQA